MGLHRDVAGQFVGRSDELAALTQLRRDSHRYGRSVVVVGEPGIGKSRLIGEFLRQAPRGRAAIGIGRALEHVRSPFSPWIAALAAVAPRAAQAIRPNGETFKDKASMYETVVSALRESAQRRSTILVLEDLHWADAGSLELLHVLLAQIPELRRLFVIATARTSEAQHIPGLLSDPNVSLLELRPLPSRECADLVRALLPAKELRMARVERIAALSGGNPFFVAELCRNTTAGDIPLTLSSAIEARITPLQRDEIEALEAAAILGEEFRLQLLGDTIGCSAAEAAKRLEAAQVAGMVAEASNGSFRFAHALTRAVITARLTSARRIELHKRAAQALEQRRNFDPVGFAQLAYHYAGAHDNDRAYGYRMRAGGLAYTVHAYSDAATFFGDAAECAEAGSLERASALARQGDALIRTSSMDEAERAYATAISLYRAAGSVEQAARLYQSLARSLFNQDRVRDALALMEHATAELAPLPPDLNDELNLQAAHYGADLNPELGLRWLQRVHEESMAFAPSGGAYYSIAASIHATLGNIEAWNDAVSRFERNVAAIQPDGRYIGHFGNLAANALFLGVPAMALYEQCFALARTLKMDVFEAAYASHAAFERWIHGDDESFARYAEFAARHDAPIPALHSYVLLNSLLANSSVPELGEVEPLIAGGRNEFFGPLVGMLVRRLARSGDMRRARRLLDAAAERMERAYAAWETLTAMAEFGSDVTSERAAALLWKDRGASAPAFAATAAMVDALRAQRAGDSEERDRAAARARSIYASMGWVRHERRAQELGILQPVRQFSGRELQIARLLQEGRSNRAMAAELFISEKTVEKHVARLYEKLQVNNRAAAVRALTQLSAQE